MVVIIYALMPELEYREWGRIEDGTVVAESTLDRDGISAFEDYVMQLRLSSAVSLSDPQSLLRYCNSMNFRAVYLPPGEDEVEITSPRDPYFE